MAKLEVALVEDELIDEKANTMGNDFWSKFLACDVCISLLVAILLQITVRTCQCLVRPAKYRSGFHIRLPNVGACLCCSVITMLIKQSPMLNRPVLLQSCSSPATGTRGLVANKTAAPKATPPT